MCLVPLSVSAKGSFYFLCLSPSLCLSIYVSRPFYGEEPTSSSYTSPVFRSGGGQVVNIGMVMSSDWGKFFIKRWGREQHHTCPIQGCLFAWEKGGGGLFKLCTTQHLPTLKDWYKYEFLLKSFRILCGFLDILFSYFHSPPHKEEKTLRIAAHIF